ncbi:MAG: LamG domain-containing protein [Solirubrobacteraceae bacterium]
MLNRLTFVVVLLATAALATSPALAASGPAGVWKLDEGSGTTVADSSGNDNDGALSGGVSWVSGVFGPALDFDGLSGQVKVDDNTALEPPKAVTVSAWFKHDGSPGTYRYIVAKGGNGCIAASYGLYSGPDGGLQFYVSQHRGSVYARSPDARQRVWDGDWHLAVGTYDGSTVRLYVDGVQVGSGTSWPGSLEYLLPSSNDFYIGNYPSCQPHRFLGAIDDVMVWRRALSAAEIKALVPASDQPPSSGGGGGSTGDGGSGGTGDGGGGNGGAGTGTTPGSGPTGTSTKTKDSPPSIHGVKLSNYTVTVDTHGHVISGGSTGLSLTYNESQAASLRVTLLRSEKGVRRRHRCVASSGHGHRARSCRRFVVISSVMRTDRAGRLTVKLNRLLHRRLRPGIYRLDVTPRAHGKVGKTVSVRLVVRRSHGHR